jgi:uncharacterized iron-regulated protein
MKRTLAVTALSTGVLLFISGCTGPQHKTPHFTAPQAVPQLLAPLLPATFLLLGELHDVDGHQQLQAKVIQHLAAQQQLHAVVLEMADRGHSTLALPAQANEAQVQQALQWNTTGWPWVRYGPAVMSAVRMGVPVYGGNLPRHDMRAAMLNTALDASVQAQHLVPLQALMQESHCGLLPVSQLLPMVRIQIGRDVTMAQTLLNVRPIDKNKVTLLITGNQHARKDYGVPWHLRRLGLEAQEVKVVHMQTPTSAQRLSTADALWTSPAAQEKDHCAELRQRMAPKKDAVN